MSNRYVALLRGINVGGSNIIKMVDLRGCFETMGFSEVATLIQSGNVVFAAKSANKSAMVKKIEQTLSKTFAYQSRVAVVSANELARVVEQAPAGFGKDAKKYRYDVLFLIDALKPSEALEQVSLKPGVDDVHAGDHALYFRRLIAKAAQSHLPKLIQRPAYKSLTIRNWNTTTKLLAMVSE